MMLPVALVKCFVVPANPPIDHNFYSELNLNHSLQSYLEPQAWNLPNRVALALFVSTPAVPNQLAPQKSGQQDQQIERSFHFSSHLGNWLELIQGKDFKIMLFTKSEWNWPNQPAWDSLHEQQSLLLRQRWFSFYYWYDNEKGNEITLQNGRTTNGNVDITMI